MNDMYHEQIIEEARQPQFYGRLVAVEMTLEGKNASCGDEVTIFLKFARKDDPTSPIAVLSWEGQGCVISRAAMSVLAGKIIEQKMTLTEIKNLSETDLEELLGLPQISIGRIKCLVLGLRTLQSGV